MLARQPRDRFDGELAASPVRERGGAALPTLLGLGLALLAVGLWWLTRQGNPEPPPSAIAAPDALAGVNPAPSTEGPVRRASVAMEPEPAPAGSPAEPALALPPDHPRRTAPNPAESTSSSWVEVRASVTHRGAPVTTGELLLETVRLEDSSIEDRASAFPDSTGRIQWRWMLEEPRDVPRAFAVLQPSTGASGWASEDHPLLPGSTLELGAIELELASDHHPIPLATGHVRDELGRVVPDLRGSANAARDPDAVEDGESRPRLHPRNAELVQMILNEQGSFEVFGPPSVGFVSLSFRAINAHEYSEVLPTPSLDLEVVLSRVICWRGRLRVPEEGPDPGSYGVWMYQNGGGVGVGVAPSGRFEALGTTSSAQIRVTYPVLGATLFEREVVAPDVSLEPPILDVGEVDLRGLVTCLDVEVLDPGGEPAANAPVLVDLSPEATWLSPAHVLDDRGHLVLAVPRDVGSIELRTDAGTSARIDVATPPKSVVLGP